MQKEVIMVKKSEAKIETLEQLLIHELGDLYDAEKQIVKALPKISKKIQSEELKEAVEHHLDQTKNQVSRLEEVFQALSIKPRTVKCAGMQGLIKEGDEFLKDSARSQVGDAGIIGMSQKIEHYEISSYGTACAHAAQLGAREVVRLLEATLKEEKETDKKLTQLAESHVNQEAQQASASAEQEEEEEEKEAYL